MQGPQCPSSAGDPVLSATGGKYDVTGVFGVSCRHGCLLPNGVVDFHKGERCVAKRPASKEYKCDVQHSLM